MKAKIDRVFFQNRWKVPKHLRSFDWTIIGIRRFSFSRTEYEYSIEFFGLRIRIWMKKPNQNQLR